jgi:hypothetical protein
MDDTLHIQLQCIADEVKYMRTRMERVERRIQMLTDSFVVAGLWRTTSALEGWKCTESSEEDMLQFEMTND